MTINQLENIDLQHLVESGNWMGGINANLMPNEMFVKASGGTWEPLPKRRGESFRVNESEVGEPDQDPVTPVNIESRTVKDYFNNGLDPDYQKQGYFEIGIHKWASKTEVLADDSHASFADLWEPAMRYIGEKASYTFDLQARRALNKAYLGGNTYVTTLSASPVTELDVADTNGFNIVYEDGIPYPVSASHPLAVTIVNGTLGTVTRNVVGCTPGTRVDADDTVPGSIELSAAVDEIAVGDSVTSSQAPPHIAPNGKTSPFDIDSDDLLDMVSVFDILSALTSHGNAPFKDGHFHFIGGTNYISQFWRDPDFKSAVQGQYGSKIFTEGMPVTIGNITFHFSHRAAESMGPNGVKIRRAVILADRALCRGYWEKDPAQEYNNYGTTNARSYDPTTKIHTVITFPRDDLGERYTCAYKSYQGFAARTSHLAKFGDYPDAPYKMGVGLFSA